MSRQSATIFNNPLIKQINNKIIINFPIYTKMASQHSTFKIQNNANQNQNLLVQKQQLIKQLVERCNRQEKRLTKLLHEQQNKQQIKVIEFKQYSKYINELQANSGKTLFICLKLQNQLLDTQQSILISNNLELQALPDYNITKQAQTTMNTRKQIGILVNTDNQSEFQQGLTKNVQVLQQNINKCQSLLTSLKQLNEGDPVNLTQTLQTKSQVLSDKQKQKSQKIQELKSYVQNLQLEILKYSKSNEKLRQKIQQLEQAQQYYLTVIEQLQINRIKYTRGSPSKQLREMKKQEKSPNKQKKKSGKLYLLNY